MKKSLVLLASLSCFFCSDPEPIFDPGLSTPTCLLQRIDRLRGTNEVALRDSITYSDDGKMLKGFKYTRQPGKDWVHLETRNYHYGTNMMELEMVRSAFTITGTFVLDEHGNLLDYSDDYFAQTYSFNYDGSTLYSDGAVRYVVRNGNIVERIDINSGQTLERFTYDDHPNPMHGLFFEPINNEIRTYFKFYNANNVLSETQENLGSTLRYSYEYGTNGFPTKQTLLNSTYVTLYVYGCE